MSAATVEPSPLRVSRYVASSEDSSSKGPSTRESFGLPGILAALLTGIVRSALMVEPQSECIVAV